MGSRGLGIFLIGAALLAGCGDDDDDGGDSAGSQDSGEALRQDAAAKGDARMLASGVEACYADQQDYSLCKQPEGVEPGVARVEKASASTFEIVATSESGNEFRLTRAEDGAVTRTCTEPETGGCEAAGTW